MLEIIIEIFGQFALELSDDNKVSKSVRTFLLSIVFVPLTILLVLVSVKMFLVSDALLGMVFAVSSLSGIGALVLLCRKIYK